VDQNGRPSRITGLSGVTFAGGEIFLAVQDNSDKVVRFDVSFNGDCSIKRCIAGPGVTVSEKRDYEGVAFDALTKRLLLSDEDAPGIHEIELPSGKKLRDLPIPEIYLHGNTMTNQGFESLALSPDRQMLWTANERALICDGNTKLIAEPMGSRTRVRLQQFIRDGEQFKPAAQYVYQTSGVHDFAGQIGLCDLVALPDRRLLALERCAARNLEGKFSIRTRIFLVELTGAPDVSGPEYAAGLKDKPITMVAKTPLYDGFIFDADGENLEGLCLGPPMGKGRWAVLGVVDDSDGVHVSKSRLVAFELLLKIRP
jgi:hypothetical protein